MIPDFTSTLTSVLIELEKLRTKKLITKVHPKIFFQLKGVFHLLESLESARIEGNNTTLKELVEKQINNEELDDNEKIEELVNIQKAIDFIEQKVNEEFKIDESFIFEIHNIVTKDLDIKKEGSSNPGMFRRVIWI